MKMPHLMRDRYRLIREVVMIAVGTRPQSSQRRRMAQFLHALADELAQPRPPGHGHGIPGEGIRWTGRHLVLGRALWKGIGESRRISADVSGTTTRLYADPEGDLHVVVSPKGSIHVWCYRVWMHAQWAKGWRPGRIERGAIVFDIEATRP